MFSGHGHGRGHGNGQGGKASPRAGLEPESERIAMYASVVSGGQQASIMEFPGGMQNLQDGRIGHASSIGDLCRHNAKAASLVPNVGELPAVWTLLAGLADEATYQAWEEKQVHESCGQTRGQGRMLPTYLSSRVARRARRRGMVDDILKHYQASWDVQTLATITCVLGSMPGTDGCEFGGEDKSG
ncbi:unnamed protein product, partial [Discosporangium mesarthrocarpum]